MFPDNELESNVTKIAEKINSYSSRVIAIIKESVKKADETFLTSGLAYEKLLFQSTFSLVMTIVKLFRKIAKKAWMHSSKRGHLNLLTNKLLRL